MNKILLLAPKFYEYTNSIIDGIKSHEFEVDFFDTRPPVSNYVKAKMRKDVKFNNSILEKYKNKIIECTKNCIYKLIIVIACVTFNKAQLSEILALHPECKKIFYMWDSFCNYPKTVEILSLFDKNYSFDPIDCSSYNMNYQPTFYSENCLNLKNKLINKTNNTCDIFFIASFLPQRYKIFKKFNCFAESRDFVFKYHLYIKSFFIYLYFKAKNLYLNLNCKHFKFKQMSEEEKIKNIISSKCILDIPFNNQAGLTMRVIEGIVLGKKIITTNKEIKSYDFYDKSNFAVISENDFSEVTDDFINSDMKPYDDKLFRVFSVDSWINNIVINNL